jgi:hypothetical protein
MTASVDGTTTEFKVGTTRFLFDSGVQVPAWMPYLYDVSRNGQQFLAARGLGVGSRPITLVSNWPALLREH